MLDVNLNTGISHKRGRQVTLDRMNNDKKIDKFRRLMGYNKFNLFGHDMLTTKRILARGRTLKKIRYELEKAEQELRDVVTKSDIDLDHTNE